MTDDLDETVIETGQENNDAKKSGAILSQTQTVTEAKTKLPEGEINLNALLDVEVSLSVEIGRSKLPIKQLLSLNQGSVVELDRAFDEPLDLMVNGMLIARGEVVVVDGQFGLRLIDIVSQPDRLKNLK